MFQDFLIFTLINIYLHIISEEKIKFTKEDA